MKIRMYWTDTRIIEPSRDRIRFNDLTILRLHKHCHAAMYYSRTTLHQRRCCLPAFGTLSRCFHCNQLNLLIIKIVIKRANCITPSANAGNDVVRIYFI